MHREGCHSRSLGRPFLERRGRTLGASTRRGGGEVINLIRADSGFFFSLVLKWLIQTEAATKQTRVQNSSAAKRAAASCRH